MGGTSSTTRPKEEVNKDLFETDDLKEVKNAFKTKRDLMITDDYGMRPIMNAAMNTKIGDQIIKYFISLQDDVNAKGNIRIPEGDSTALHIALLNDNLQAVKVLLEHGADPTIPDGEGVSSVKLLQDKLGTMNSNKSQKQTQGSQNLDVPSHLRQKQSSLGKDNNRKQISRRQNADLLYPPLPKNMRRAENYLSDRDRTSPLRQDRRQQYQLPAKIPYDRDQTSPMRLGRRQQYQLPAKIPYDRDQISPMRLGRRQQSPMNTNIKYRDGF